MKLKLLPISALCVIFFSSMDPHSTTDVSYMGKIQRQAARWVTSDYARTSSVTSMVNDLQWPTLYSRQKSARLLTFYKLIHHLSTPPLPS